MCRRCGGGGGLGRRRVSGKGVERGVRGGGEEGVAWSMYKMHVADGTVIAQSETGVCNMYPTNLLSSMSTA